MNKFMIMLDRKLTGEIEDYFFDMGCNPTFTDEELLPDMLFVETKLSVETLRGLKYVIDVRTPYAR